MHWRITFGAALALSWFLYRWLPIESSVAKFLVSGLFFSLSSRTIVVVWYQIHQYLILAKTSSVREKAEVSQTSTLVHSRMREQQLRDS
jgi:hypothetical protein